MGVKDQEVTQQKNTLFSARIKTYELLSNPRSRDIGWTKSMFETCTSGEITWQLWACEKTLNTDDLRSQINISTQVHSVANNKQYSMELIFLWKGEALITQTRRLAGFGKTFPGFFDPPMLHVLLSYVLSDRILWVLVSKRQDLGS